MTEAELDRIAAGIRPSWELDDAPFRPGGLASPELEALLATNGVSSAGHASHTNGAAAALVAHAPPARAARVEQEDLLTRVDPVPPIHVLEEAPMVPVRVEAAPAAPLPVPQHTAEAAPQSSRAPSNRPPPMAAAMATTTAQPGNGAVVGYADADPFGEPARKRSAKSASVKSANSSADFPAIKKSNKGLYIALGGGAVALVVAAIVFTSSSGKTESMKVESSPTPTQMPGTSTTHEIPPPPATDDLPAATAKAQPTQTAAPPVTADTATVAPPAQTAAPTHVAHADNPPPAQHHSSPPASHSNPPASGGSGKGKGGIVRDVPF
jgi:hypothetical protein